MLLRFGVENFMSFRDPTELSMVSTRLADPPQHRHAAPGVDHGVLPVVALYGANAAGKSNLLAAFEVMRQEVVDSFVNRKPDGAMNFGPFKLGGPTRPPWTRFDVDFVVSAVRYTYGFRYDAERVLEEWLYAYPEGYRQVWFHRNAAEADPFYFGPNLLGRKQTIADLTRPNSLLLSAAAQNNQQQLMPLYRWFSQACKISSAVMGLGFPVFPGHAAVLARERASLVRDLLRLADVGVAEFRPRDLPRPSESDLRAIASPELRKELVAELSDRKAIELGHTTGEGEVVFFDPSEESHGTNMLLFHANTVMEVLEAGQLLVLDELDASLHPRLSAALVRMFTDPEANPNGAQLLVTTHDESLLPTMRRDSIVFVQKGRDGASELVPLSDFKTRGRDDIRRAYAEGRFGGTPTVGDLAAAIARHRGE